MSGREFIAIWAGALAFTAFATGWAFAVQYLAIPEAGQLALGAGLPLLIVAIAMWMTVRD